MFFEFRELVIDMYETDNINKTDTTKYSVKFRNIGGINLMDKLSAS